MGWLLDRCRDNANRQARWLTPLARVPSHRLDGAQLDCLNLSKVNLAARWERQNIIIRRIVTKRSIGNYSCPEDVMPCPPAHTVLPVYTQTWTVMAAHPTQKQSLLIQHNQSWAMTNRQNSPRIRPAGNQSKNL